MNTVVTVPTTPAYSMKPLRPLKCNAVFKSVDHISPGPAAYQVYLKEKKALAGYSIGGRLLSKKIKSDQVPSTPGPGQCTTLLM
jgi:hypothetical protein